jgi:transcriptional regulator with XRE-family HTH domain
VNGAEQVRAMRQSLGRELAARRRDAGYSQRQLAPLTGYARSTLSDAELGRHHVRRDFWERCQRVLHADGVLTDRYDQIEAVAAAWRAEALRTQQAEREERAARQQLATREGRAAAWPPGAPAAGDGSAPQVPASIVTVQLCPSCRQPVAVITVLATPPG